MGAAAGATVVVADGDAPVAVGDTFVAYRDCPISFAAPGVLSNDPVPAGLVYAATAATGATAQAGAYELASSGALAYAPPAGFVGADSFTYTTTDGVLSSLPASVGINVVANVPPSASFTASSLAPRVFEALGFVGAASDAEGGTGTWVWDFGDGTGATGPSVTHMYGTAGVYVVRLTVPDGQCGQTIVARAMNILPAAALPPAASAAVLPPAEAAEPPVASALTVEAGAFLTARTGESVTLHAAASSPAAAFHWVQTAGAAVVLSGSASASPTFTAPATPDALYFEVTASDGTQAAVDGVMVVVESGNRPPVAKVAPARTAEVNTLVLLDGSTSVDPDGDPLTFRWVQWEGQAVILQDPLSAAPAFVMPPEGGTFRFALEVDDGRATAIAVQTVSADTPTTGPLRGFVLVLASDGTVKVEALVAAASYAWDFGDGATSTTRSGAATHTYAGSGTYVIRLTVLDPAGTPVSFERTQDVVAPRERTRDVAAPDGGPGMTWLLAGGTLAALALGLIVVLAVRRRRVETGARQDRAGRAAGRARP